MELIVIELFLWAGLIFFFWALKDNLGTIESDIEDLALLGRRENRCSTQSATFARPDKVLDAIGCYRDEPIYQFAVIDGKLYRFDHICPSRHTMCGEQGERRYLAPGLAYVPVENESLNN